MLPPKPFLGVRDGPPNSNECPVMHNFEAIISDEPTFKGDTNTDTKECPNCFTKVRIHIYKAATVAGFPIYKIESSEVEILEQSR